MILLVSKVHKCSFYFVALRWYTADEDPHVACFKVVSGWFQIKFWPVQVVSREIVDKDLPAYGLDDLWNITSDNKCVITWICHVSFSQIGLTRVHTRTPWIVNKSLNLVWFKWGSQWWGILKHFPQRRYIYTYTYIFLVERKEAEFYHYIDRRRWLVWLEKFVMNINAKLQYNVL